MLKTDWKQNFIVLIFSLLLFDVLTSTTLTFVAFGIMTVIIGLRPNKIIRNIVALAVFGSYWVTYGKIIDPEIGLNFLTSIIVLKILERESERDRYMIFFGLLLLISAGTLFEKTLTYVFFFSLSFLILIQDFYSFLGQPFKLKDFFVTLLWVLPLTIFLFFFVPRLMNPIPFNQNTLVPGEIGYTPDVNISEVGSLQSNNTPVFQVMVSERLKISELYWRGNTLSFNDGWNWKLMPHDKDVPGFSFGVIEKDYIVQKIRLFTTPEYFFALDLPGYISFGEQYFKLKGDKRTHPQQRFEWVQKYKAYSQTGDSSSFQDNTRRYLQISLSKAEKNKIQKDFSGKNLNEVTYSIKDYFRKNQFSYSLSPGQITGISQFLENKTGFCSHFASAAAIILRVKGIPTRLISGYMGGNYNSFGDFYLISQNDAHVWVEALENGKWVKLDPTEWIAPDRVQLGGEAFVESVAQRSGATSGLFRLPGFLNVMRQWFQQWDFFFYNWLEQMDYYGQEAWLEKINFKREWLFSAIPLILVFFMLIYTWFLSRKKSQDGKSEYQELWRIFFKRMKKKGFVLSEVNISSTGELIKNSPDENLKLVWKELVSVSFEGQSKSIKDLKARIRKI